MTSPPETDREYAYFRVIGVDDPTEITELLGIEPHESWHVGEEFTPGRGNVTLHRRSSSWRLDSGLTDQEPMSSHIEELLNKLERHSNSLWLLRKKF